ncbi:hypothetical protein BBJ29_010093 [Phytophthora kernoviae]|uniref:Uncharacterized protein n=1 Tax=Phytophthora kernoviae TaxID=325452 RepID=A0A3F2RAP7_9STRA|nr:hypothetical protein BBP00_00010087 [Phytophthora kernoviae]RLN62116.1 hypothetical protein BBJ29_010093 [Phytophthora kernoviae]
MVYTIVVHLYAKEGKEVEEKLRNKLIEASQVYSKDIETIDWHTFDPYVIPLLDQPMDLRRFNELDTSKPVHVE